MGDMKQQQFNRAKEIVKFLAKDPTEEQCEAFITDVLKHGIYHKPANRTFRLVLTRQAIMLMEMVDDTWIGFRDG